MKIKVNNQECNLYFRYGTGKNSIGKETETTTCQVYNPETGTTLSTVVSRYNKDKTCKTHARKEAIRKMFKVLEIPKEEREKFYNENLHLVKLK